MSAICIRLLFLFFFQRNKPLITGHAELLKERKNNLIEIADKLSPVLVSVFIPFVSFSPLDFRSRPQQL